MCARLRLVLMFAVLAAWSGVPVAGAAARPGAAADDACGAGLAVLVDRSASMADHDPYGELRLAVADGARAPGVHDRVVGFDDRLGTAVASAPGGWAAAIAQVMAGGDRGPTDLRAVLREAATLAPLRLVVITDGEAELDALPAGLPAVDAIIGVGGSPAPGVASAVRAQGGRVLTVRSARDARGVLGSRCGDAPVGVVAPRNAVLVAGLGERTPEVRGALTQAACRPAAAVRAWCSALVARGWRVWVPSIAPGRRGGALLDSTGALDANGAVLARWLGGVPRAVLVGHSMGGVIVHAAIDRGAAAEGLITVGTPHAGSYGADAYFAAIAAARGCLVLCPATSAALTAAAIVVRHRFGSALGDLTRDRRTRTARLAPPRVPFAAWAGTVNAAPTLPAGLPLSGLTPGDYLAPNDGIVGRGSATGAIAGLHPSVVVDDGAARHSAAVPPRSAPTELGSPAVADWIDRVAKAFPGASIAERQSVVPVRGSPRAASSPLRSLAVLVPGAAAMPVDGDAVVVATSPIGVVCDDVAVAPVQVAPGLWFLDLGLLGCARVGMRGAGLATAAPGVVLGAGEPEVPAGERVSALRTRGGGWRLAIRLTAPGHPLVTRGGRALALSRDHRRGEWRGDRRWVVRLGRGGVRHVAVRVDWPGRSPRVGALALP